MTAAQLDVGWGFGVVAIFGIIALCFLAVIFLVRAQRSHRLRVGFFVERDVDEERDREG